MVGEIGPSETAPLKETQIKNAVLALRRAVSLSQGAALVNMGESGLDQVEMARRLPNYYQLVTVEEILERKVWGIPKEKKGLVVTGYSKDFLEDLLEERKVESFIRAQVNNRGGTVGGDFCLLVLSDSLPSGDVFHDANLPWFNGPFQGGDSVWSIKPLERGVLLIRHDLKHEMVRDPKPHYVETWVIKQEIPFDFS